MKVVLGIRQDAGSVSGGDVVQMEKTGKELERLGCKVDYRFGTLGDLEGIEIAHVFNTTRIDDTYRMVCAAQQAGCPVVVSTIWHSMREMARAYAEIHGVRPFPIWSYTAAKEIYYAHRARQKWGLATACDYRRRLAHVITTADALLPNSQAELLALTEETGCKPRMTHVIPNGYEYPAMSTAPGWALRTDIVCAGRIEPRKNQVRLAQAFKAARIPSGARLHFFGAALPQAHRYLARLQRELVPGRLDYGGRLSQDDLYVRYSLARVTVLASHFETTGLSALEGLACGCAVVITDSPCTREYFGNAAHYCDSYSKESIAAAVERAWHTPPGQSASLLERYTWQKAGRATLDAYAAVLRTYKSYERI